MYLVYNYMLHVVLSQNMHKSSTSHANAQLYIYRLASSLKLTDVTSVLASVFPEHFSLKVMFINIRTSVRQ